MSKSHRTVKSSSKVGAVSPAKALSAAKRVRDGRTSKMAKPTSLSQFKSAPALVKK